MLECARRVWPLAAGKRIFLTGATGFVGKWMLEALLRANDEYGLGCKVSVLTRNPQAFIQAAPHLANHSIVTLLQGDVLNLDHLNRQSWDCFVHAATDVAAATSPSQHLDVFDVNVIGTRNVLELARKCQAEHVLLTSSGAVYGKVPSDLVLTPEDYPGAPSTLELSSGYGVGKRSAEWLASAYADCFNVPTRIARIYALVGPYLATDKHFAIGNFIGDKLAGRSIVLKGDGTPHRSYMYAADLAVWLWTILFQGQTRQAYNVGSDASLSLADVARKVASASGPSVDVQILKVAAPGGPVERYAPDITKARTDLDVSIHVAIEDAIERTLAWHRSSFNSQ